MADRILIATAMVAALYVALVARWAVGAWRQSRLAITLGSARRYAGRWSDGRALGAERVPDGPTIYVQHGDRGERPAYVGRTVSWHRRATQHRHRAVAEGWSRWEAFVLPRWRTADALARLEAEAIAALNPRTNVVRPKPEG
ncbi:MAG: hypothetical protein RJA49_3105 [Actinomycetota bacterium]|jgi:hypothetical protein